MSLTSDGNEQCRWVLKILPWYYTLYMRHVQIHYQSSQYIHTIRLANLPSPQWHSSSTSLEFWMVVCGFNGLNGFVCHVRRSAQICYITKSWKQRNLFVTFLKSKNLVWMFAPSVVCQRSVWFFLINKYFGIFLVPWVELGLSQNTRYIGEMKFERGNKGFKIELKRCLYAVDAV